MVMGWNNSPIGPGGHTASCTLYNWAENVSRHNNRTASSLAPKVVCGRGCGGLSGRVGNRHAPCGFTSRWGPGRGSQGPGVVGQARHRGWGRAGAGGLQATPITTGRKAAAPNHRHTTTMCGKGAQKCHSSRIQVVHLVREGSTEYP